MAKKKITQSVDSQSINYQTGEIISKKTDVSYLVDQEDNFIKSYFDDIGAIYSLPHNAILLMVAITKRMDYENILDISAALKKDIAAEIGTNTACLSNNITKLLAAGFIKRIDVGRYFVNPKYFAKGAWKDIVKRREAFVKLTVTYKGGSRDVSVEFGGGDE